jgi:hypothetical protein
MRRMPLTICLLVALLWPKHGPAQSPARLPQIGALCPTTCFGSALDAFRRALDGPFLAPFGRALLTAGPRLGESGASEGDDQRAES